jgi:hypothetical protein
VRADHDEIDVVALRVTHDLHERRPLFRGDDDWSPLSPFGTENLRQFLDRFFFEFSADRNAPTSMPTPTSGKVVISWMT